MTQIDQSIVQMKFDNQEFERRASTTMSTLDKLKAKLTLGDSAKAMRDSVNEINNANFDSLSRSAERYGDTLSSKVIAKLTVVQGLMNKVMSAGENMVKSLAVDPISNGWDKYENKLAQMQTIMNATGKSADDVETYLDELAWYADETSYSFDDMTRSVGQFTSSGVDIEKAIPAVIGIANAGGLAGTSIQNVSHAMEGFAKAIGQGYMQANQWDWIETARINTEATKQAFIDAAVELGKLQKQVDGSYLITGTKDKFVSAENFTAQFRTGWLDSDVLLKGLQNFGDYTEGVYKYVQETGVMTADAMDALSGKYNELGEKGMRAAQESKTLGDAIQAVRDAVSSGWTTTFQTIFGGFEEAKELWATVYDELYEIFGVSGELRNELLEGWADLGGREVLLDTLWEGWSKIKEVVGAVKEGIRDVIPQKTADQLYETTVRFKEFVGSLKLSEDAMYSLRMAARWLAVPFKLLGLAANIAGTGIKVFIHYANKATNTILTMAANTEYATQVFKDILNSLFGEVNGERIYNSLNNIFGTIQSTVTTKIAEIRAFLADNEFDFKSIFSLDNLKEIRDEIKEIAGGIIADMLEAVSTGNWDKFTKGIKTVGTSIKQDFVGAIKVVSDFLNEFLHLNDIKLPKLDFSSFEDFLQSLKDIIDEVNPFTDVFDVIREKGSSMFETVKEITIALVNFCKNLSPAKILIFGFGLSLIDLIAQFSRLTSAAATVVTSFSGIGKSAKGVLDAIKNRIYPTTSKFSNIGDMILKIAVAIGVLAVVLYKLSDVPEKQLEAVTDSLFRLIAIFGGMTALLAIISTISSKLGGAFEDMNSISLAMLAFAASIGVIAGALYILDSVDMEEVQGKLLLLTGVVIGASVAITLLSKLQTNQLDKGALSILSFAGAILIITQAINMLDPKKATESIPYLIALFTGLSVVMLASAVGGESAKRAMASLMKIAIALGVMTIVINAMGSLFEKHPARAVIGMVTTLTTFLTMLIPFAVAAGLAGKGMGSASKSLLDVGRALTLMVIPITVLGLLPMELVTKGIAAVSVLMVAIGLLSKLGSVGGDKSIAKNLAQVGLAMTLLVIPIAALGYLGQTDPDALGTGLLAVSVMLALLGAMSKMGSVAKDARVSIMPAVAAIGIFTAAILLLTVQDWESVKRSVFALSSAVLALGLAMHLMVSAGKDAKPADFKNLILSVAAIGVLMAGIVAVLKLTQDSEDPSAVIAKLGGISLALAAMGIAVRIMSGGTKEGINAKSLAQAAVNAGLLGAFAAEAALLIGLLSNLGSQDWTVIVADGAALSTVLLAMAGAAKIMNKGEHDYILATENAVTAGAFLAAATVALGVLGAWQTGTGSSPAQMIANAISLSLILVAMAGAARIMSDSNKDYKNALPAAGSMSLMLVAAAGALWILGQAPVEGMLEKATALSEVLVVVSGIAVLFGKVKIEPSLVLKGMEGVLIVVGAVAIVVSAIAGIGYLLDKLDEGTYDKIINGIDRIQGIVVKIGEVLGGFVGGVAAGFNNAATSNIEEIGDRISTFINNVSKSIENITKYDESILTHIDNFKSAVTKIKESAAIAKQVDADSLSSFSTGLVTFAENYIQFAEKIQGATDYSVTAGVNAMSSLATMTETLASIKKFPDMSRFGTLVNDFAPYLIQFSEAVGGANFTPAKVTAATNAAAAVAGFVDTLTASSHGAAGGFLAVESYFGGTALSDFGYELSNFGICFNTFASNIKEVDQGVVDSAIATASSISAFAEGLPKEGGLPELLMGRHQDLGTFATNLSTFAVSWVTTARQLSLAAPYADAAKTALSATETISTFANNLPSEGGVLQYWLGEKKTLSTFATELSTFADPWVAFSTTIAPAASFAEYVKTASKAAVEVADIYDNLPTSGGALTTWIFGTQMSLTEFGQDLNSFGWNFKQYGEYAKDIDKDKCVKAAEAVSAIVDTYAQLPTTGGWLDKIVNGDTVDMSTIAQSVKDMGKALSDFNDATQGIMAMRIVGLANSMVSVVDASKKLGEFKNKNVKNFKDNIEDLREAFITLKEVVDELPDNTELEASMSSFDTLFGDSNKWTTYGENLLTGIGNGISNIAPDFAETVKTSINDALNSQKKNLTDNLKTLIQNVAYSARTNNTVLSKVKQVGTDIISGVIKGLEGKRQDLYKSLADTLVTAVQKGKEAIESHSPSKLTRRELGEPMMQGVAGAIADDKTVSNAMSDKLTSFVTEFGKILKNPKSLIDSIKIGLGYVSDVATANASTRGREAGEAFASGLVAGLRSVNFNRSTIEFGRNLTDIDSLKQVQAELDAIDAKNKALEKATETTKTSPGYFVMNGATIAADEIQTFLKSGGVMDAATETVHEFIKEVKELDFQAGFTFDDLVNYLDNIDLDKLSASSRVFINKITPVVENIKDGLDVLDTFNSYMSSSGFDIDKTDDLYKQYSAISEKVAGAVEVVGEVEETVHDLANLEGYTLTLAQTSTNRIKAITDALEAQAEIVTDSEARYLEIVSQFGKDSEQARQALEEWAGNRAQQEAYQKQLDEINHNGAQSILTSTTKYATTVLDAVRDKAEELRDYIGTEGNAYVELVDRLQADIADGIVNDPRIIAAIEERFSDIISMYDGLMGRSEKYSSIAEKEYNLWLSTEGRGASETEKNQKKLELIDKQMSKAAEKQYVASSAMQEAIAMFGSDSDEALDAQEKYIDAYQELVDLAEERAAIEHDISVATSEANKEQIKGLTAREKAEKEFAEWKKDGSLKEWRYYGATDEELMDALIKKYTDEEEEAKKKAEETTESYYASAEEVQSILKGAIEGIDTNKINQNVSEGLNGVVAKWAAEWVNGLDQEINSRKDQYYSSMGIGSSGGVGGAGGTGYDGGSGGGSGSSKSAITLSDFNQNITGFQSAIKDMAAGVAEFRDNVTGQTFGMSLTPSELVEFMRYRNVTLINQEEYAKQLNETFNEFMKSNVQLENVQGNLAMVLNENNANLIKSREASVAIVSYLGKLADSVLAQATDVRRQYGKYGISPEYYEGSTANEAEKAFYNSDLGKVLRWAGLAEVPTDEHWAAIEKVTDEDAIKALTNILSTSSDLAGLVEGLDYQILKQTGTYIESAGIMDFIKQFDPKTGYEYSPTVEWTGKQTTNSAGRMLVSGFSAGNTFEQLGDVDFSQLGMSILYGPDGKPHLMRSSDIPNLVKQGYSYYESGLSPRKNINAGTGYTLDNWKGDMDILQSQINEDMEKRTNFEKGIMDAILKSGQAGWIGGQYITPDMVKQMSTSNIDADTQSVDSLVSKNSVTSNAVSTQFTTPEMNVGTAEVQDLNMDGTDIVKSVLEEAVQDYIPDADSIATKIGEAGNAVGNGIDWLSQGVTNIGNMLTGGENVINFAPKGAANVGHVLGGALLDGFGDTLENDHDNMTASANNSVKEMNKIAPKYADTGELFCNSMFDAYNAVYEVQEAMAIKQVENMANTIGTSIQKIFSMIGEANYGLGITSKYMTGATAQTQESPNIMSSSSRSPEKLLADYYKKYKPEGVGENMELVAMGDGKLTFESGLISSTLGTAIQEILTDTSKVIESEAKVSVRNIGKTSRDYTYQIQRAVNLGVKQSSYARPTQNVTNYNQTINSPKAVSRYDVYRDTKNLLSRTKGAMN